MKMPDPMMVPTMMATPLMRVSFRFRTIFSSPSLGFVFPEEERLFVGSTRLVVTPLAYLSVMIECWNLVLL